MDPRTLVVASGALLIAIGVGLVVAHSWLGATTPEFQPPSRALGPEGAGARAEVQTTYVGLAPVVVGAFLEAVGLFGRREGRDG